MPTISEVSSMEGLSLFTQRSPVLNKAGARLILAIALLSAPLITSCAPHATDKNTHLFILAGQSNMVHLDELAAFAPHIKTALPNAQVSIVKHAVSATGIGRWYRNWPIDIPFVAKGDIYDRTFEHKIKPALATADFDTVTLVWMQGEWDSKSCAYANAYEESLKGLYTQLSIDLDRQDIFFIIGRITDAEIPASRKECWNIIRDAQESAGTSDGNFRWINTDDLNGPDNGIHMTEEGYRELGKRFAVEALDLIHQRLQRNHYK